MNSKAVTRTRNQWAAQLRVLKPRQNPCQLSLSPKTPYMSSFSSIDSCTMKFTVKAWSNGRARAGLLHLDCCPAPIETPALLLSTRKGLPLFISPDLLPSLPSPDSSLLQVSPLHLYVFISLFFLSIFFFSAVLCSINVLFICSLEGLSMKTISKIGGLHQLLGLHEYGFAAVPRDSIQCLPEANSTNKIGASFETPCGRLLVYIYFGDNLLSIVFKPFLIKYCLPD